MSTLMLMDDAFWNTVDGFNIQYHQILNCLRFIAPMNLSAPLIKWNHSISYSHCWVPSLWAPTPSLNPMISSIYVSNSSLNLTVLIAIHRDLTVIFDDFTNKIACNFNQACQMPMPNNLCLLNFLLGTVSIKDSLLLSCFQINQKLVCSYGTFTVQV